MATAHQFLPRLPAQWSTPRLTGVLLSLLLGGCTAGPDYAPRSTPAPADWSSWRSGSAELHDLNGQASSLATPVRRNWWTVFADPTLDQLQARALQASPDLKTAALHFAQSRLQRQATAAQRGPSVNASGSVQRQRQSEYDPGTRLIDSLVPANESGQLVNALSSPFTLYQAGFDASWEVDLWGRVRRSIEAADASMDERAALLDDARLSLTSEVARDYFELRAVQQQIRLTDQDVQASAQSLELIQARHQGGLVDELDVSRQRTQLADLRAQRPPLLAQEAQTINQIGLLLGLRPGELQDTLGTRNVPPLAALPDLALGIPSEVAHRRPDIRAAEARLHAATANIGIAVAALYPSIILGATFGYDSFEARKFGEWSSRNWTVGPSLELPIFDNGRRRTLVRLSKLEQQEAAVAYQQAVLKAWQEVDDALSAYSAETRRNQQLRDKARTSRQAWALAKARHDGGLTDFLVELDSQRTFLQAQRELTDSDGQLRIRLVSIYKAIGGGNVP